VSWLPANVFGDRLGVIHDGFCESVTGNETVDLSERQACVLDGIESDLYAELTWAFIRHDTHIALRYADQRKLAS
jgi:hypothetical protein